MTDAEMLDMVKTGLGLSGPDLDASISIKLLAVKQYILNAGVTIQNLESDLGIATLTVGVNDLWDTTSGEVKFSEAFDILMGQLKVVSIP